MLQSGYLQLAAKQKATSILGEPMATIRHALERNPLKLMLLDLSERWKSVALKLFVKDSLLDF